MESKRSLRVVQIAVFTFGFAFAAILAVVMMLSLPNPWH